MADTKITALTSISTIDLTLDVLPIVDTSDTGMAPTGTTKKVTTNQLLGAGGTASFATLAVSGLTTLSNNIVMASAKGIDFTATANSSGTMTAELLNDYEEGTWVPTDASGAALTFTSVTNCLYTKIGRAVTIQGKITYPSTANTNTAAFTGLPFASGDIIPLNINYAGVSRTTLASAIGLSTNTVDFYSGTAGSTTNVSLSGVSIWFSGTYMT